MSFTVLESSCVLWSDVKIVWAEFKEGTKSSKRMITSHGFGMRCRLASYKPETHLHYELNSATACFSLTAMFVHASAVLAWNHLAADLMPLEVMIEEVN